MVKRKFAVLASVVALLVAAPAAAADSHVVSIAVGENSPIDASDITSYSLGTAHIVDVKVTADMKQLVFIGLKPGATTVLVLRKNGQEETYHVVVNAKGTRGTPW